MDLSVSAQSWVNLFFLWLGFGTVVGITAQVCLPSGEPKGILGILVIGVSASCFGPLAISLFLKSEQFNPISPIGFIISVLVALVFLLLYRFALILLKKKSL
ncbi:MAG: hypothetical protein LBC20_01995 [Planctomycetaceae bacterium]|jgi:uncharacterized membrane protein YeaQ/YmgE (transglycosylase-associated protein family)|nr:hypothetical protein [Planctomycetaceae bacterium]